MNENPLVKKLGIKPGMRVLLLNAPEGFQKKLDPLPGDVTISETPGTVFDYVLVFVASVAELERYATPAVAAYKEPGGHLWFAYPKKSGKIKTDISRDAGWDVVEQEGFMGVTLISIDETWSCLRLRKASEIKKITRKF